MMPFAMESVDFCICFGAFISLYFCKQKLLPKRVIIANLAYASMFFVRARKRARETVCNVLRIEGWKFPYCV